MEPGDFWLDVCKNTIESSALQQNDPTTERDLNLGPLDKAWASTKKKCLEGASLNNMNKRQSGIRTRDLFMRRLKKKKTHTHTHTHLKVV